MVTLSLCQVNTSSTHSERELSLSASLQKKDTYGVTDPPGCGRNLGITRSTGKLRSVSKIARTQVFSPRSAIGSTRRLRYHQSFFLRVAARIIWSFVLACAATECLYIADRMKPYSAFGDRVTDVLTFPGFIMARFFQPVSIHTVGVSDDSWWAFFLGNSFFLCALLLLCSGCVESPPRVS